MSKTSYVVVAGNAGVGDLVAQAASLGGPVIALVAGRSEVAEQVARSGVAKVVWFGEPEGRALEAFAPEIAAVVGAHPGHVFGGRRPAERVLLGAAAISEDAPVLVGVTELAAEGDRLVVTHQVGGGIALETVVFDGPVAILADGGPVVADHEPALIEEIASEPLPMRLDSLQAVGGEAVDLTAAPLVVSVGRGLQSKDDLPIITALAQAIGAEVACSRPLAEGLEWLPKDRYVGISGNQIAPALYLAVGISGQLQHMGGVRGAETVVAINTDPKAPIASQADYVVTGDLYQLVPALTEAVG
jgi:electron transfer flavoprotein alpha subunit